MLDHVAKRQQEIKDGITKSFMTGGGADGTNGVEMSEKTDVSKSGMKKTMDEWKEGDLKSGSGAKVTDQKQAIAIGLSEEGKTVKKGEVDIEAPAEVEFDEKKDKTKLKDIVLTKAEDEGSANSSIYEQAQVKKSYPPTTTGMTAGQHKELTKSGTMIEFLSTGQYHEHQKANILASYGETNDIQKSKTGEGSRGGKVMGHTSSGKPIYTKYDHPGHKDFTKEDHEDASDLHSAHAFHYMKGDEKKYHRAQAGEHASHAKHLSDKEVLGKTKGGKKVYTRADHAEHKSFTPGEHREAALLHKEKATGSFSHEKDEHEKQYLAHHDIATKKEKEAGAAGAGDSAEATKASKLTDVELTNHYSVESPSGTENRSRYFKALHAELLKREKDPKSKFYAGKK